ncbi:MAG: transglutaminase-like domain-containing protein, partial [Oscillospiraceae bacterium]|nr:transglutaminase-like domain-containing protein [Oscillospiraceae bacterium]
RQSLISPVLPGELNTLEYKLKYHKKHKLELSLVRSDTTKSKLGTILIFTIVLFSICLAVPKQTYTANRAFFDAAINAQTVLDYLTNRFNLFTEVADPSSYKRNNSDYELFRVNSDEPIRIKGKTYDSYNYDKGTWSQTFPAYANQPQYIKYDLPLSRMEIVLNRRRYIPNTTLAPTGFMTIYPLDGLRDGTVIQYISEKHIETDEIYNTIIAITDPRKERYLKVEADDNEIHAYEYIADKYNPEKEHIPNDIVELAEDVTKGLNNDYLRAKAIEKYLTDNYIYDLDYESTDINDFLFGEKRGVCYEFATSMVLMSRAVGIPARFATGFAAYQYDFDEECFIVREKNAHAFPELYILGYGWISFEPTAAIEVENTRPETATATITDTQQTTITVFLILVAISLIFYFLLLPFIKEQRFLSQLKKSDIKTSYNLIFNKFRDIFSLPLSATLEDIIRIADFYTPINRQFVSSVIYNDNIPTKSIIEYYKIIKKAYRKS